MKRLIGILISFCFVMPMGCGGVLNNSPAQKSVVPVYLPNENSRPVSFKPGSEPEGFNGIKWGTNLLTLERMKRIEKGSKGIEFYLKKGDVFKFGNGKLIPIQYGFWRGKFYVGMVTTESLSDWNALKEVVFNKYGEGAKPFRNKEEYLWVGKNALMALRYDEISKEGIFYIKSESISRQMEDYRAEVK